MSATMQVFFIGCESAQGLKKETRVPYGPFFELRYAVQARSVNTDIRQVQAHGFKVMTARISPEMFQQLCECKPMSVIDVTYGPNPENLSETVFTGVVKPGQKPTQAA